VTVRKGQAWGSAGGLPDDGIVVGTDAEVRALVEAARRSARELPIVGLLGGDLCASLGGTGDERRMRSPTAPRLPIDVVEVTLDDRRHWFVAHLVARRRLWSGRFVVAANAERLGAWKVAPRAHPGDGLVDVLDGRLGLDDRLKARRRLPAGDHLPHPAISVTRAAALRIELDRPLPVRLDGQPAGPATRIELRVEPDALIVVV
jgi:diacylglycerol kinase family enzyme